LADWLTTEPPWQGEGGEQLAAELPSRSQVSHGGVIKSQIRNPSDPFTSILSLVEVAGRHMQVVAQRDPWTSPYKNSTPRPSQPRAGRQQTAVHLQSTCTTASRRHGNSHPAQSTERPVCVQSNLSCCKGTRLHRHSMHPGPASIPSLDPQSVLLCLNGSKSLGADADIRWPCWIPRPSSFDTRAAVSGVADDAGTWVPSSLACSPKSSVESGLPRRLGSQGALLYTPAPIPPRKQAAPSACWDLHPSLGVLIWARIGSCQRKITIKLDGCPMTFSPVLRLLSRDGRSK
jgi:hypothetical protein